MIIRRSNALLLPDSARRPRGERILRRSNRIWTPPGARGHPQWNVRYDPSLTPAGGGGGGGSVSHGDEVIINSTGPDFGSNALNLGFTGGSGGIIESTAAGAEVANSFSGWNLDGGTGGSPRGEKRGFDDATRNRVFQSIYSTTFPDCGCFTRDMGSGLALGEKMYYTSYVYFTNVDNFATGQIKLWRLGFIDDITDPNTALYGSSANHASGLMVLPRPGSSGTAVAASNPLGQNNWYRLEVIIEVQSVATGTELSANATTKVTFRVWNGSSHPSNISFTHSGGFTNSNMTIYDSASTARYFIIQYYMGNSITTGTVRQDDHYIQKGTIRRVELANNSNYAAATHTEIQEPTFWSSGQIRIKFNQGSFGSGTAYLHTFDATDTSIQVDPVSVA